MGKRIKSFAGLCALLAATALPAATIVLPVAPAAEEVWAGHELARDWELAMGEKAILKLGADSLKLGAQSSELAAQGSGLIADSSKLVAPSSAPIFYVGDTSRGTQETALPFGADEETFRVRDLGNGSVVLRGATPAATAEAVVWFAQHCLGLRWYMPGPLGVQRTMTAETVKASAAQDWHGLDVTVRPAWLSRSLGGLSRPGETVWAEHNLLRARWTTGHNLAALIPAAQFAAHPDWFPWIDGKRYQPAGPQDDNWQPNLALLAVADEAARQLDIWLTEHPEAGNAVLCVNDSIHFDQSPATRALLGPEKWFRGRPDYSDLVFTFTNRVADALAQTWPGKKLTAYAYYWAEQTPSFPVARNVIPYLTADRAEWFDPAFAAEDQALIARWAKAGPEYIGLYDYYYGSPFLVPRVTTAIEAESITYAYAQGARAFYAEAYPNWALDGPKCWLAAQLLWDPSQPAAALLDDYYANFWRESAAPMREFYEACERAWMNQPRPGYWIKYYRDESQWRLFPPALCAELRGDLEAAARLARTGIVRKRVAFVSQAFAVTESFVNFCAARDELTTMVLNEPTERTEDTEVENEQDEPTKHTEDTKKEEISGEGLSAGERLSVMGKQLSDNRTEKGKPITTDQSPLTSHCSTRLLARLDDYLAKKQVFLAAYAQQQREAPLAIAPTTLDEYLRNDPSSAAARLLLRGGKRDAALVARLATLAARPDGEGVRTALVWHGGGANLLFDPGLKALGGEGPTEHTGDTERKRKQNGSTKHTKGTKEEEVNGSQIPAQSFVWANGRWGGYGEPVEGREIELRESGEGRALRFTHCKRETFSQWAPAHAGQVYEASVRVRAKVSPGNATYLLVSWLDADGHYAGRVTTLRLPAGDWSASPVELRVLVQAPPGAAWAGYGLLVENQVGDDFAEFSEPVLTAAHMR